MIDLQECVNFIHTEKFELLWSNLAHLLQKYFRVEVEGIEYIPRTGSAIIAPNHSGYAGIDAVLIAHILHLQANRVPKLLAHRAYFQWSKLIRLVSLSFGLREATLHDGIQILRDDQILVLFPEGESGNFKSTLKRYHLQKFHTGFLRMAVVCHAPIIPCVVVGSEESFINLGSLDLSRFAKNLRIPFPVILPPLPAKWKIRFLPPIPMKDLQDLDLDNQERVEQTCDHIRRKLQKAIHTELKKRSNIFV